MSDYQPYVPMAVHGVAQPDTATQLVLQATYGRIMHAIKEALDPYVHELAEQAMVEFNRDEVPGTPEAILEYLTDLADSPWVEDTASEIAPAGAPRADIEMAMKSILRASAASLNHAIRVTTAVNYTSVGG